MTDKTQMTDTQREAFERAYNRLFSLRGVDTKHMADCEEVWQAALTQPQAQQAATVKDCLTDGQAAAVPTDQEAAAYLVEWLLDDEVWTVAHASYTPAAIEAERMGGQITELVRRPLSTAPAAPQASDLASKASLEQYKRMFGAACEALGSINEALGLDPEDGGAEPILEAISRLQKLHPSDQYLLGHQDGLEWAAGVVEMDDPRTGDWMYDDRTDLANAIRRGPEMPPAAPQEDNELLVQALGALQYHTEQTRPIERTRLAIEAIDKRLHGGTTGGEEPTP